MPKDIPAGLTWGQRVIYRDKDGTEQPGYITKVMCRGEYEVDVTLKDGTILTDYSNTVGSEIVIGDGISRTEIFAPYGPDEPGCYRLP